MSPDDPAAGIREWRFHRDSGIDSCTVIVTVYPDGTGKVEIFGSYLGVEVSTEEAKESITTAVRTLSIARHLVFEEFKRLGGTVEELREEPVK